MKKILSAFVVILFSAVLNSCEEVSRSVIEVKAARAEISGEGDQVFVSVRCDHSWELSLQSDGGPVDWAALDIASGTGNRNNVRLTAYRNESGNDRSLRIVLDDRHSSAYCTVTQKGKSGGTPDPDPNPDPDPVAGGRGWYELPVVNTKTEGGYVMDSTDPSLYYAYHLCDGGEKGPGQKKARNYTVCYSAEHHCPVWVAAPRHEMYEGSANRTNAYGQDPDIPSGIQYSSKSAGGAYNKGHMLGSAERTSSSATNRQVFYYTNIAPQNASTFNTGGGGWNILEDWVDGKVCRDTLYVVIGTYFDKFTDRRGNSASPKTISYCGRNDVGCPTMFYYVLLRTKGGNTGKALKDCSSDEIICAAFVRSHSTPKSVSVSEKDMMSVSDLEKITGFTYFPNVPNAPKSSYKASDWGL